MDSKSSIDELRQYLADDAERGGYHVNPDTEFVEMLLAGLKANNERYGYLSCPCRLAAGNRQDDLDIICPCDYRDSDLAEFGVCYCALYVSSEIAEGKNEPEPIPDRRPPEEEVILQSSASPVSGLSHPVWRCKVCGYICARNEPPDACPICKVEKDRFERFM